MAHRICISLIILVAVAPHVFSQTPAKKQAPAQKKVHKRAHAHNDYLHARPLLDAVDNGFCSVEADVVLVKGQLLVAHTFLGLRPQRTLKALYLDPLQKLVQQNGGSVHGDGTPFTLLIDFKTDGESTYRAVDKLLETYPGLFASSKDGVEKKGPVIAIASGSRPTQAIAADVSRFIGIDGRIPDLHSKRSESLMPLISDNWRNHFTWRGKGEMPVDEQAKLVAMVKQAHQAQRRLRFWASPDVEAVWKELDSAGVDLINTDDLPGLRRYFEAK